MVGKTHLEPDARDPQFADAALAMSALDLWFVREVLPLEATLNQFLRRNCRNRTDIADLCQEVYARVYEAAQRQLPDRARPFVSQPRAIF